MRLALEGRDPLLLRSRYTVRCQLRKRARFTGRAGALWWLMLLCLWWEDKHRDNDGAERFEEAMVVTVVLRSIYYL